MSVSPFPPVPGPLAGPDGELISLRIAVEPCRLERLLETLAALPYHINPQIQHCPREGSIVEFPAYQGWIGEVRRSLAAAGMPTAGVESRPMVELVGQ